MKPTIDGIMKNAPMNLLHGLEYRINGFKNEICWTGHAIETRTKQITKLQNEIADQQKRILRCQAASAQTEKQLNNLKKIAVTCYSLNQLKRRWWTLTLIREHLKDPDTVMGWYKERVHELEETKEVRDVILMRKLSRFKKR